MDCVHPRFKLFLCDFTLTTLPTSISHQTYTAKFFRKPQYPILYALYGFGRWTTLPCGVVTEFAMVLTKNVGKKWNVPKNDVTLHVFFNTYEIT